MRELRKKDLAETLDAWARGLDGMSLESQREYNAAAYEWSKARFEKAIEELDD